MWQNDSWKGVPPGFAWLCRPKVGGTRLRQALWHLLHNKQAVTLSRKFPERTIQYHQWTQSVLLLFTILVLLSACSPQADFQIRLNENLEQTPLWAPAATSSDGWSIAFDSRLEPKDDVRQVASLAEWLEGQMGEAFGVYIPSPEESLVDSVCSGRADFAVVGTVSYLQAHQQCGAQILARGLNADGKDTYRAAIIVAANNSLQTLADLKGHAFAFGAVNSTQGHLIPRLMLQQAGLGLEDFSTYTYTASHTATANAVTSGRVDAGALQDTLAAELARRGLVRILAFSEPYPSSGIIASPDVPSDVVESVRQALLRLDPLGADSSALYDWQRTEMPLGFVAANDDEYEALRQIAETVGLLRP